jgi:hypothetical protein
MFLQTGQEFVLAPQQITSCDKTSFGCNGGLTERAYEYVIRAGGLDNETEYPYTSGEHKQTGQEDPAGLILTSFCCMRARVRRSLPPYRLTSLTFYFLFFLHLAIP